MIFILAVMITLVGVIADDGLSLIINLLGYGAFETNPIYTRFGLESMLGINLIFYAILLLALGYMVKRHRKDYARRAFGYKIQDIGPFMLCFFVIFMAGSKAGLGFHNATLLKNIIYEEDKMQELKVQIEEVRETEHESYLNAADKFYWQNAVPDYGMMLLYVLGGFLLYKTGYSTRPNGVD